MKIKFVFRTIIIATILVFNSCNISDLYDSDEISSSNQDEIAVYKDPSKAQLLVDQLYALIPDFASNRFDGKLSTYCDEAIDATALSFNLGSWSPNNVPGFSDMWSGSYRAIRTANKFLEKIDSMPLSDQYNFTETTRDYMKNQARCLRAFFYSELIRCYGGVPITTKSVKDINGEIYVEPRQRLDSTVNFVVNEIDSMIRFLPKNVGGTDYGRVTRGFALSIKSRLLLYMASPLFNGTGADETGNPYVCYGSNDPDRWKKALDAARDVISLNSYSLFTSTTVSNIRSVYSNVFFLDRGSSSIYERIFSYQKALGNSWNQGYLPLTFRTSAGWPHVFPTYNAHIAFQMQDGKAPLSELRDNGDGTYMEVINPESTTNAYNPTKPYEKRDSRYYDCILF
ncbi:MAG: RagB/SusD family nutrient uptake outer membrane protein, partial [Bacteroidia bacterium]|nr:RagB/SusD family nutrient uptake outer membrane protein [Bacteroidia bacterium]